LRPPASTDPRTFDERFAVAMQFAQAGHAEQAAIAFAALVQASPRHLPSRQMLVATLRATGRNAHALTELDAATSIAPEDIHLAALRSEILLALGRAEEAVAAADTALTIDPGHALARMHRAHALLACSRAREAAVEFATVRDARPGWLPARRGLVRSLLADGDMDRARVAANDPALFDARDEFIATIADFTSAGAARQRADLLRAYMARHPRDVDAAVALAAGTHALGRPGEALQWSAHALALQPRLRSAQEIRAASLIDRGDIEEGLAIYRDLLRDGNAETMARYLVLMHYDPLQTNAQLFAAHRDFSERYLRVRGPMFERRAHDPDKVLRIGWLSPRFAAGPVATFLGGLLARFDRSRHRHLLIDLLPVHDASAQGLHALADEVVDAGGLDDGSLLRKLRSLDLDIAIDLAGHSTSNRLAVLAERVAPLQVCWLDWFDTTALPTMDAWISDAWLTPADSSQCFSERVIRLDAGRFCYTPIDGMPVDGAIVDVSRSPLDDDERTVVFGSFNRLAKFNDGVIDAWVQILQRIPDAQLELRARLLDDPDTRSHLAARFAARGIDVRRLRLRGELPYRDLLAAYRHIDIALDPFPFSGCTTTCDALWMGCPTITLPGATFVSRQSASLLWRLGRDEWVARDRADYVDRALALARDVESVRAGRSTLRAAVHAHLCDAGAQATDFGAALRALWRAAATGPMP
jgi:predicted O-linked N-acetylglucosamine transferase (SPINDLY family)